MKNLFIPLLACIACAVVVSFTAVSVRSTQELNLENDKKIADITADSKSIILLNGGKGGLGNTFFKSSTNRAPTRYKEGKKGSEVKDCFKS